MDGFAYSPRKPPSVLLYKRGMKKLLANSSGLHYHIHCLGHVVAHTLDVPLRSHRLAVAIGISGPDHQGVPTGCGIPDNENAYALWTVQVAPALPTPSFHRRRC